MANLEGLKVTGKEFAGLIGVSVRSVRNWQTEGCPGDRKGIPLQEGFRWWRTNKSGIDAEQTIIDLKREKLMLENEKRRLELLIQKGEYIARSEILQLFLARISIIKQGLMGFHRALSPMLAGKDAREISNIIKRQVLDLLNRFSRRSGMLKR